MCGVFGIRSVERDVARLSYFGLFALQHRGQEAAGIAVSDRGRLTVLRDMGLVAQVFDEEKLQALPGEVAIGHTRYSTTGANAWSNVQPLVQHGRARTVAIGHNGNLTNAEGGIDWVLASETCAFDLIGAVYERDVRPGEVVVIDENGLSSTQALPEGRQALCIFEHVYFARPDSTLAGSEVHGVRVRMGERLAAEAPVAADLVMPIPDSGTPAAVGYSRASGIPYSEGLIKNRYVGRTFIQPDDVLRQQGIKMKFNPLAEVAGQRLVIVDDSIVRGSTMRQLVIMLFEARAAEVHVRVSSPPIVSPCFYGIDMADEEQLAAAHRSVEQMRELIGASSLHYLSLEGMQAATRLPEASVCRACFTRDYPTRVPESRNLAKLRFEPIAR
jgi:amidophosphoribosyltransferase